MPVILTPKEVEIRRIISEVGLDNRLTRPYLKQ
jgi:hypothetical protein